MNANLQPHRGTLILVLGIVGLVCCFPVGIAAWIMGNGDLKAMAEGRMDPTGEGMTKAGLSIRPGVHPIVPVMLGDAKLASAIAEDLLAEGIYVIGFFFPVVPKGQARIRTQMSAAHTRDHLDRAIAAFTRVAKRIGVLG